MAAGRVRLRARDITALTLSDPLQPEMRRLMALQTARGRGGAGRTLEGARVALFGLGKAEMNSREGLAGAFDPYDGRYTITLYESSDASGSGDGGESSSTPTGATVRVKAENVMEAQRWRTEQKKKRMGPEAEVCDVCGASPATLCSGCQRARYCGCVADHYDNHHEPYYWQDAFTCAPHCLSTLTPMHR